jgi:hypothetical protein
LEPTVTLAEFTAALSELHPEAAKDLVALSEVLRLCTEPRRTDEFWAQTKCTPEEWLKAFGTVLEARQIGSVPIEHQKDVLRRLGPCGDLDDPNEFSTRKWAAAYVNDFRDEKLAATSPRELFAVLDLKAEERHAHRAGLAEAKHMSAPEKASSAVRQAWMDRRHPGWSLPQWRDHTGMAYETLKKYWNGITTSRTRSVRFDLAKAEKVDFATVPE